MYFQVPENINRLGEATPTKNNLPAATNNKYQKSERKKAKLANVAV